MTKISYAALAILVSACANSTSNASDEAALAEETPTVQITYTNASGASRTEEFEATCSVYRNANRAPSFAVRGQGDSMGLDLDTGKPTPRRDALIYPRPFEGAGRYNPTIVFQDRLTGRTIGSQVAKVQQCQMTVTAAKASATDSRLAPLRATVQCPLFAVDPSETIAREENQIGPQLGSIVATIHCPQVAQEESYTETSCESDCARFGDLSGPGTTAADVATNSCLARCTDEGFMACARSAVTADDARACRAIQ